MLNAMKHLFIDMQMAYRSFVPEDDKVRKFEVMPNLFRHPTGQVIQHCLSLRIIASLPAGRVRSNLYAIQSIHSCSRALNCRCGCHFCRHKSNQKGCQQKCFFAHKASALQISQNLGLLNFYSTAFPLSPCFIKNC
jgi:hypothetical protein